MEIPLNFAIMSLTFVYDLTDTTAVLVYVPKTYFVTPALRICVQCMQTEKECTYAHAHSAS